ncbi:MAG TPA: YbhB/YbcL family Raf kinase inhibitor-like protein [bacterium]|nr:YbhB/YbcL family Raf kinase inhibitor-like protein [bacterium]HPN45671.1 YbhB/YbcL family Raf kinase inhibitor-like protein [bacterium]
MKLSSAAFTEGGMIPSKFTCDGVNVSPSLAWEGAPVNTKTLALIVDDPDAPAGIWVHWVLFNIPPQTQNLSENVPHDKVLVNGASQGINDFRKFGYGGPCPPGGTHRYYFKLYALDTTLKLAPGSSNRDLVNAMRGHILAEAQLMGKYKRSR